MKVITLTTDMGLKDYYVASVKGTILRQFPEAVIIDISHQIAPFDVVQAYFVLSNCYVDFPKGTIHIIGVNPFETDDSRHLLIEHEGHYFIGADNGIFSLLFPQTPSRIYELNLVEDTFTQSFPTKNIFAKAATHIAKGGSPEVIGNRIQKIKELQLLRATAERNIIKGTVIYIDSYGNVITNISIQLFNEVGKNRPFKIYLTRAGYTISKIRKNYNEVPEGEKLALFSSSGHLEIAINKGVEGSGGGANKLFGLKISDTITIEFEDISFDTFQH